MAWSKEMRDKAALARKEKASRARALEAKLGAARREADAWNKRIGELLKENQQLRAAYELARNQTREIEKNFAYALRRDAEIQRKLLERNGQPDEQ